jgi:hypothetical protein
MLGTQQSLSLYRAIGESIQIFVAAVMGATVEAFRDTG